VRAGEILRNTVKDKLARNQVVASMTVRLVRGVEIVQIAKTAGSSTRPGPRPAWRRDRAEHLVTYDSLPRSRTPLEARNLPRRPASGSDRRSMGYRLLDRRRSLQNPS
jgi:hypothetical protein